MGLKRHCLTFSSVICLILLKWRPIYDAPWLLPFFLNFFISSGKGFSRCLLKYVRHLKVISWLLRCFHHFSLFASTRSSFEKWFCEFVLIYSSYIVCGLYILIKEGHESQVLLFTPINVEESDLLKTVGACQFSAGQVVKCMGAPVINLQEHLFLWENKLFPSERTFLK